MSQRSKTPELAESELELARARADHPRALGMSEESYDAWCVRHGFSRRLRKTQIQLRQERLVITREVAAARLLRNKQQQRHTPRAIADIFAGRLSESDCHLPHLQFICRAFDATKANNKARDSLYELLIQVQRHDDFFNPRPAIAQYGHTRGNTFIEGLVALAGHCAQWRRPVKDWKHKSHNTRRQFAALTRHLLADYPVPAFFDSVWFKGNAAAALQQQRWFIHVGVGNNPRTADLPIPFTKRMAHHFLLAPQQYTVEGAIRWGQIHGLGGNARIAHAILGTRLGREFDHDDFWATVLRFLIENPLLDTAHFGPIIDYLHHQRFVPQEAAGPAGGRERRVPAQPNLSMKGRSPAALLRQVEAWHRQLARHRGAAGVEWQRCAIPEFEFAEGQRQSSNGKLWTIRELLSRDALMAEGQTMRHCVASYAYSCHARQTSIWALEVSEKVGYRKMLTVEVNLRTRVICQARGRFNALPDERSRNILRRWATEAGLTVAQYI